MRRVSQALVTVFAAVIATGANATGTAPATQGPALRTSAAGKPAAVVTMQKPVLRTTTAVKVPVSAPKMRVAVPVAVAPRIRVAAPVAVSHAGKPKSVKVAVVVHRAHVVKKRVARRYSPTISLPMDEVRVVAFTQPVSTIFVGNPLIADVSMIDNRHAFVLGKSFGATNIVALNADGKQVVNQSVSVFGHTGSIVVLHRGVAQATYTCASSRCESAPTPGDDKDSFSARMDQVASHQEANVKAASAGR